MSVNYKRNLKICSTKNFQEKNYNMLPILMQFGADNLISKKF